MIVVDSGIWIDYFNGVDSIQTAFLDRLLDGPDLLVGDLIIAEVLRGFDREWEYRQAERAMRSLNAISVSDPDTAFAAARHHRHLRSLGFTVRKTVDILIATRCIADGHALLHRDRDFQPFIDHLGLLDAMTL